MEIRKSPTKKIGSPLNCFFQYVKMGGFLIVGPKLLCLMTLMIFGHMFNSRKTSFKL